MCAKMTRERAEEFGAAWNSRDADLVTSFFAENGVYHASVGFIFCGFPSNLPALFAKGVLDSYLVVNKL